MTAAPPPQVRLIDRDAPTYSMLGGVCAMLAMLLALGALAAFAGPPADADPDAPATIERLMILQLVAGFAPIAFVWLWPLRAFWLRGARRRPGMHIVGLYVAFMVLWVPLSFFGYATLLDALGVELPAQPHLKYFVEPASGLGFVGMIASVCVVGPIYEEIVFRGFLQTGLRRVLPPWLAVVVVGLLFGFMHGAVYGLPLALMGMFFGYLRERDDSMLAPILAHILHNSVTVAAAAGWPELISEVYAK